MMIDRRKFVAGAALTTIAPTLALLPASPSAVTAQATAPVILIDGWSIADETAAPAIWLRVGRSWTAAWR